MKAKLKFRKKHGCTRCLGGKQVRKEIVRDGRVIGYKMVKCSQCRGTGKE